VAIDADALKTVIVANFATEFGEIQPPGLPGLESAMGALADAIAAAHNSAGGALPTIEIYAGTARSMANSDNGAIIRCTAGTTVTITVPAGLTPGVTAEWLQEGAGQIQVVGAEVTLRVNTTFNAYTAAQWSSVVVTTLDTDEALVRGDLETA
jgi:hypothetical protein